jgi:glycosyltransferase involved in cell wall biosynthesis
VTAGTPAVSVLMTSYNREALIGEAIESVLAQSFADFELIVIDDQSIDRSVEIANEHARRDCRVGVKVNARNLGDYGNRRQALTLARGRYVKYHDSDDVMYPHCLAVMVAALEREPSAAFALSASHAWPGGPCPMLLTPRLAYEREFLGGGLFQLGPAAALFRTEALRELGGFDDVAHSADYLFWIRACARVNVLLVPGDLFHYRVHSQQEAAKPANDLAFARAAGAAWRMLNSSECPLTGEALETAKRNFAWVQARGVYRHLKGRRIGSALGILEHAGLTPADWARYLRPPRRDPRAGTPTLA